MNNSILKLNNRIEFFACNIQSTISINLLYHEKMMKKFAIVYQGREKITSIPLHKIIFIESSIIKRTYHCTTRVWCASLYIFFHLSKKHHAIFQSDRNWNLFADYCLWFGCTFIKLYNLSIFKRLKTDFSLDFEEKGEKGFEMDWLLVNRVMRFRNQQKAFRLKRKPGHNLFSKDKVIKIIPKTRRYFEILKFSYSFRNN